MSERTLAVVLARAGSKGLPGKNERMLAGKPCVRWTIEHVQASRSVDRIVLSTDGDRLATIGLQAGVDVVRRGGTLAHDNATVDAAARHALEETERTTRERYGAIALLYANVPVRPDGLLDEAVELIRRTGCDSVQSYADVGKHHPYWTAVVEGDGGAVRPWQGDVLNHGVHRRQDLPPAHIPDGGVIVCSRDALTLRIEGAQAGPHAFFGIDRRGVVSAEGAVIDIDNELDAIVAEAVLRRRLERGSAA